MAEVRTMQEQLSRRRKCKRIVGTILAMESCSCVVLTSYVPVGRLHCSRPLFLTRLYLLLPWSRTFARPTTKDGGSADFAGAKICHGLVPPPSDLQRPPWMAEVRTMHDSRDGGVRATHDCMDAGGRATQEQLPRKPKPRSNRRDGGNAKGL